MKVKLRLRRLIVLLLSTAITIPNLSITTLAATTDISYLDKYGSCEIANSYIKDGVFFLTDKDESIVTGDIYNDESAVDEADFDTWYDKALQNIKDIGIEEFNTYIDKYMNQDTITMSNFDDSFTYDSENDAYYKESTVDVIDRFVFVDSDAYDNEKYNNGYDYCYYHYDETNNVVYRDIIKDQWDLYYDYDNDCYNIDLTQIDQNQLRTDEDINAQYYLVKDNDYFDVYYYVPFKDQCYLSRSEIKDYSDIQDISGDYKYTNYYFNEISSMDELQSTYDSIEGDKSDIQVENSITQNLRDLELIEPDAEVKYFIAYDEGEQYRAYILNKDMIHAFINKFGADAFGYTYCSEPMGGRPNKDLTAFTTFHGSSDFSAEWDGSHVLNVTSMNYDENGIFYAEELNTSGSIKLYNYYFKDDVGEDYKIFETYNDTYDNSNVTINHYNQDFGTNIDVKKWVKEKSKSSYGDYYYADYIQQYAFAMLLRLGDSTLGYCSLINEQPFVTSTLDNDYNIYEFLIETEPTKNIFTGNEKFNRFLNENSADRSATVQALKDAGYMNSNEEVKLLTPKLGYKSSDASDAMYLTLWKDSSKIYNEILYCTLGYEGTNFNEDCMHILDNTSEYTNCTSIKDIQIGDKLSPNALIFNGFEKDEETGVGTPYTTFAYAKSNGQTIGKNTTKIDSYLFSYSWKDGTQPKKVSGVWDYSDTVNNIPTDVTILAQKKTFEDVEIKDYDTSNIIGKENVTLPYMQVRLESSDIERNPELSVFGDVILEPIEITKHIYYDRKNFTSSYSVGHYELTQTTVKYLCHVEDVDVVGDMICYLDISHTDYMDAPGKSLDEFLIKHGISTVVREYTDVYYEALGMNNNVGSYGSVNSEIKVISQNIGYIYLKNTDPIVLTALSSLDNTYKIDDEEFDKDNNKYPTPFIYQFEQAIDSKPSTWSTVKNSMLSTNINFKPGQSDAEHIRLPYMINGNEKVECYQVADKYKVGNVYYLELIVNPRIMSIVDTKHNKQSDYTRRKGTVIGAISDVIDTDRTFDGLYLEPEFKNKAEASYLLNDNITLYAKWSSEQSYSAEPGDIDEKVGTPEISFGEKEQKDVIPSSDKYDKFKDINSNWNLIVNTSEANVNNNELYKDILDNKIDLIHAFNIDVNLQINNSRGIELYNEPIHEFSDNIELTFETNNLIGAKFNAEDIEVYREHNGEVSKVDSNYNKADGIITISSDKFSTYLIGAKKGSTPTPPGPTPPGPTPPGPTPPGPTPPGPTPPGPTPPGPTPPGPTPESYIKTTAVSMDNTKILPGNTIITFKDIVEYGNTGSIGQKYKFVAIVVDKLTGDVITDTSGNAYTGTKEFKCQANGVEEVIISIDTTRVPSGHPIVVYEYMYDMDNSLINEHCNINDEGQTMYIMNYTQIQTGVSTGIMDWITNLFNK